MDPELQDFKDIIPLSLAVSVAEEKAVVFLFQPLFFMCGFPPLKLLGFSLYIWDSRVSQSWARCGLFRSLRRQAHGVPPEPDAHVAQVCVPCIVSTVFFPLELEQADLGPPESILNILIPPLSPIALHSTFWKVLFLTHLVG